MGITHGGWADCDNSGEEAEAHERRTIQGRMQNLKEKAKKEIKKRHNELKNLVKNRQAIINPYANVTNEMANLAVATQAAEFQAEESDIALANTLDAMRASGAGAGGATALAQAALQSKRGISASIQQQEAANLKAAAQGAQDVAKLKAEGEKFAFGIRESREQQEIDRAQRKIDNWQQQQRDAQAAYNNAKIAEAAAN